jgi:hypothetical protein
MLYIGKYSYQDNIPSSNFKARLSSVNITSPGVKCLTFWYQMHGSSLGVLNVYQQSGLELVPPILTKTRRTGYEWSKETININGTSSYKIVFEGVQGGSDSSISIDDTAITDGSCTCKYTVIETFMNFLIFDFICFYFVLFCLGSLFLFYVVFNQDINSYTVC